MFDDAWVRRKLRRYRRRGPDRTTRLLIEDVRRTMEGPGAPRAAMLDIGAGLGALHHALLDGRVRTAVHVEASPASLALAREETERHGHASRVEFVEGDFVELAGTLACADLVTLDRVICCYHDMDRLVGLAAGRTQRVLGAVYPRGTWWVRLGFAAGNFVLRLRRSTFRAFLHDPLAIDAVLRAAGLERHSLRRTFAWEVVVYRRA